MADDGQTANTDQAGALLEKSEDPDRVRDAVVEASGSAATLWIAFITFGAYLAAAAGSVTYEQLFLDKGLELPILKVELPLTAFFLVAPFLLVVFHGYLLLQFNVLAVRIKRYDDQVSETFADPSHSKEEASIKERISIKEAKENLRLQLPSFVFVQLFAEPKSVPSGFFGYVVEFIAWSTVIVGPVVLLLLMQVQFLPYHDLSSLGVRGYFLYLI